MTSLKNRYIINSRNQRKNSEEHVLPLINIVFLLLIFFMVSGRLANFDPFTVLPPRSTSKSEAAPQGAIINLSRDGKLAFQRAEISKSDLKVQLRAYLAENPDAPVRLKVDQDHAADEVLSLILILREAGFGKVSLLTKMEKSQ